MRIGDFALPGSRRDAVIDIETAALGAAITAMAEEGLFSIRRTRQPCTFDALTGWEHAESSYRAGALLCDLGTAGILHPDPWAAGQNTEDSLMGNPALGTSPPRLGDGVPWRPALPVRFRFLQRCRYRYLSAADMARMAPPAAHFFREGNPRVFFKTEAHQGRSSERRQISLPPSSPFRSVFVCDSFQPVVQA